MGAWPKQKYCLEIGTLTYTVYRDVSTYWLGHKTWPFRHTELIVSRFASGSENGRHDLVLSVHVGFSRVPSLVVGANRRRGGPSTGPSGSPWVPGSGPNRSRHRLPTHACLSLEISCLRCWNKPFDSSSYKACSYILCPEFRLTVIVKHLNRWFSPWVWYVI